MKKAFPISIALIIILGGLAVLYTTTSANDGGRKKSLIERVKTLTPFQIRTENLKDSGLRIEEANVREISCEDFAALVGQSTDQYRYSSLPDVNLLNTSSKTIISFALMLHSSVDKANGARILIKKNLSIPPLSTFNLSSVEWHRTERVAIEKDGKFEYALKRLGLDSATSWLPGEASDLKINVGMVEFNDGTRWMIPSDARW